MTLLEHLRRLASVLRDGNWNWPHVVFGGVVWAARGYFHFTPGGTIVALLVVGVLHELADGDFLPGHWWNGVVDVYSFVVVPLFFVLARL